MANSKIEEVLQGIHEAMLRKVSKDDAHKETIIMENRIFAIVCNDFEMSPRRIAASMNDKYGYDLTGDAVIQSFRNRRMANPTERRELFRWADNVATLFWGALKGNAAMFEKFEAARRSLPLKHTRKHGSLERILVVMIYEKYSEMDIFGDREKLHTLGDTFARYFFYDSCDAIRAVYGFSMQRNSKKGSGQAGSAPVMTHEQALMKVEQLEGILERTNTMLHDLQEEFEQQLEASKVKELTDFFAKLNSEKYGCILDELLVIRKGIDELRKNNFELPIEINGLLIMVKKLIQFVRDSHIEPIMKINVKIEVAASDVEFCNYEGTPFITPSEKKIVKVISPGWIYKDKELQISRPKVKEEY